MPNHLFVSLKLLISGAKCKRSFLRKKHIFSRVCRNQSLRWKINSSELSENWRPKRKISPFSKFFVPQIQKPESL